MLKALSDSILATRQVRGSNGCCASRGQCSSIDTQQPMGSSLVSVCLSFRHKPVINRVIEELHVSIAWDSAEVASTSTASAFIDLRSHIVHDRGSSHDQEMQPKSSSANLLKMAYFVFPLGCWK